MGRILCKKHGEQGFKEVCEHIYDAYENNIFQENHKLKFSEFSAVEVCEECWKKNNLDKSHKFSKISFDDYLELENKKAESIEKEFNKVYNLINRRVCCIECIAEVQVKQARRNNAPLLFPVFEKTLTDNYREIIDDLEKNLLEKFCFRKSARSNNQENFPAVFIRTGAFTYPLSIRIYYILSEREQNEITNFIKNFLQQTELNQAKIQFWEAESWIRKQTKLGFNYHQGEEKLLREVYLNC